MRCLIISLLLISTNLFATILNVPEDFQTIQTGINEAEDGDTVLVQPDTYVERINFNGKSITVASLFLLSRDEAYIDSTVIDGDESGCVVVFNSDEDTTSILCGFTVQNGRVEGGGGGIYLTAGPLLDHLIITGNVAGIYGGGILCISENTPHVRNTIISNNTAASHGGGINVSSRSIALSNVIITDNHTGGSGGGIWFYGGTSLTFDKGLISNNTAGQEGGGMYQVCGQTFRLNDVDIIGNEATRGGGSYVGGGSRLYLTNSVVSGNIGTETGGGFYLTGDRERDLKNVTFVNNRAEMGNAIYGNDRSVNTITNCIFWNNDSVSVVAAEESEFTISYTDFEDACAGIITENENQVVWGDGIINDDPLFVDADGADYRLTSHSPCIDAGDPDAPLDDDSTRSDMGGIALLQFGYLTGNIRSASNDEPLMNAQISTRSGNFSYTDSLGAWSMEILRGNHEITISCRGYNDTTITDIVLEIGETVEFEIELLHPEIVFSENEFNVTIPQGNSHQFGFSISNSADGVLDWLVRKDFLPWTVRESSQVAQTVDDSWIFSTIFIEDKFYVAGGGNITNYIYVLNRQFELIDRIEQVGDTRLGIRDLTFDGEILWGTDRETVFCFTLEGELVDSWPLGEDNNSFISIAWDSDRNVLWLGSMTEGIICFDTDGNILNDALFDDLYIYGLAYWPNDPDGYPLYLLNYDIETNTELIHKINPESGDTLFVRSINDNGIRDMHSLFITDQYLPSHTGTVFMSIRDYGIDDGGDQLEVWDMHEDLFWYDIEPLSGTLLPNETEQFNVTINTVDQENDYILPLDIYEDNLIFSHNTFEGETIIPITVQVSPNSVDAVSLSPFELGLTSLYPNPFNSTLSINYALDKNLDITIRAFDLNGREIAVLHQGFTTAGNHNVNWHADHIPSGMYMIRMEAGDFSYNSKVILLK